MDKLGQNSYRSQLEDIKKEVQFHETAEELGYTLFRVKKLYESSTNDEEKQHARKLFLALKVEVDKLIIIYINEAREKKDTERVHVLGELLEKVRSMNI